MGIKQLVSPHITYSNVNIVISKEKKKPVFHITQYSKSTHEYNLPGSILKFIPGKKTIVDG